MARRAVTWALLADLIPLYPLYSLLFSDTGLSDSAISALFVIWSAASFLTEVPSGALADRFSRRGTIVAGELLRGGGYLLWILVPGFDGFAFGFLLWGVGGSFVSGSLEALLYDELAVTGSERHFATVLGRVRAAGLVAQLLVDALAVFLFAAGGYLLAGIVSVAACLTAAWAASRLPEHRRRSEDSDDDPPGYLSTLRAGLVEAIAAPGIRMAIVAVSALASIDALEEYFALLVRQSGVVTTAVPVAVFVISLAGAAGTAASSWMLGRSRRMIASTVAASAVFLVVAGVVHRPLGLVGVVAFYGLYRMVLVVVEADFQRSVSAASRATVTSVVGLVTEVFCLAVYAAWAFGGVLLVAVLVALAAALVAPR